MVATDGSYAGQHLGLGYLSDTGLWGCAASTEPMPAKGRQGAGALIAELFAISMVATSVEGTAVVVSDSLNAIGYAQAWLDGEVSRLPPADTKPEMILYTQWERRAARRQEELADTARIVSKRKGEMQFQHVHGHRGHLLTRLRTRWRRLPAAGGKKVAQAGKLR